MQLISNVLFSIVLVYPVVFLREYCVGVDRLRQLKWLKQAATYLMFITLFFVINAAYIEAFIFFYIILLIPFGLSAGILLMKENHIALKFLNGTHILGIKEKRFAALVFVDGLFFIVFNLSNYAVNAQVLQTHQKVLEQLRGNDFRTEDLMWISLNPQTLVDQTDRLIEIIDSKYKVVYSGNAIKIIRGTQIKDDTEYEYDLTYRRTSANSWELDGLYTTREVRSQ